MIFYMDWYPQQLFTAEQAAAGFFKTRLFRKCVFGGPQAPFTAGPVAAGTFFFLKKTTCLLEEGPLELIFVNIC